MDKPTASKKAENTLSTNKWNHYFTFSNSGIQIYNIKQRILKKRPNNFILEYPAF